MIAHRMLPTVPAVERADHADPPRIGRPEGKGHAGHAVKLAGMGAKMVVELEIAPFAEEMQVEFAESAGETVGIFEIDGPRGRLAA